MAWRRREGKRTNEEKQSNEINGFHIHSSPQRRSGSFDSQQHVLLVLLEDGADVLEDLGVEEVDAAVYDIAYKCARLFHIM